MTGRYPMRYGLQTLVIFPSHTYGLATDEKTLPQALKEAGYKTLMTGKWHLGHADKKFWPQNRGFDYFYGNVVGEVNYFTRERGGVIDWQRNGKFLKEKGYYTDLIGDDAVKLIDQQDGKQPSSSISPLSRRMRPIRPRKRVDQYKSFPTSCGGPIRHDLRTGRPDRPDRRRARQEGPARQHHHPVRQRQWRRHQRPFAQGSKSKEERARRRRHRARAEGPGQQCALQRRQGQPEGRRRARAGLRQLAGQAGAALVNEPLHMVDVMPTLLALAGARHPDHPFDGKDMWNTLAEGAPSPNDDVLINVEAFRGAVRKGDWKLIKIALLPGKTQLFNLAKDPGETNDVAAENPGSPATSKRGC